DALGAHGLLLGARQQDLTGKRDGQLDQLTGRARVHAALVHDDESAPRSRNGLRAHECCSPFVPGGSVSDVFASTSPFTECRSTVAVTFSIIAPMPASR